MFKYFDVSRNVLRFRRPLLSLNILGDEYDFCLFFLYMPSLLFTPAKTRDPLYPFREFSGERSLQVVLNAVMEIFV